jgi:hypothetical protein
LNRRIKMRVIVSVKPTPGGGQSTQAARYVAYRERDEEREGKEARPLFSAKEESLSFWRAERVLTEGRTPQKNELLHTVISLREEDFQSLGREENGQQQALKEVTREAVSQLKDDLSVDELRWVAGIHRNTDTPHIHLLIHKDAVDRESGRTRRINRLPERTLASRITDENGAERIESGSFGKAFESALDRARDRARETARNRAEAARDLAAAPPIEKFEIAKERPATSEEILLEAARRNPSITGRELIQEIILRGPMPEPDERPEAPDIRIAFRTPSLDDQDYRNQPEQADWLGKQSQTLRDLYERGAQVKGDVLVIPAEEYELPNDRDSPFITNLSYAHEQIQNPETATEFHTLARTIAGETADPRTEIEVFRHYYAQIRNSEHLTTRSVEFERTLDEMRRLAGEMAKLETRESIEISSPMISVEDMKEGELEDRNHFQEMDIGRYEGQEMALEFYPAEVERGDEEGPQIDDRDMNPPIGSFNTAARKVRLNDESLRFPAGLTVEVRQQLVTRTLPAIDRQIENGRAQSEILAAISERTYDGDLDEKEQEERFKIGGFLKSYVEERHKDPETRSLNRSDAFRSVHNQITGAQTPEELNRIAETFLRKNLESSDPLRLHQSNPEHYPKPEIAPLNTRERNLLFFGRAPEHHTPEMRELRHFWGLTRAERAERVTALHRGELLPSPTLETMLTEFETRRSAQAVRHYQASILNEEMRNPSKLDLRSLYERIPPHERSYLNERIEEKKQAIARSQSPIRSYAEDSSSRSIPTPNGRQFGSIPRESNSYREYLLSMGAIESQLLTQAVHHRQNGGVNFIAAEEKRPLSISELRSQLPPEEQVRIREQARNLAWDRIAQPEVITQAEPAARALNDKIAQLQEVAQPRARLAHQALDDFVQEKVEIQGKNPRISVGQLSEHPPIAVQRRQALEDYAARMREELYRGFESMDLLRRELDKPRDQSPAERLQSVDLKPGSAPGREQNFPMNGRPVGEDLPLGNSGRSGHTRNSTVDHDLARLPESSELDSRSVDSDKQIHFGGLARLSGAASDRDFNDDLGRNDPDHEIAFER